MLSLELVLKACLSKNDNDNKKLEHTPKYALKGI